MIMIIGDLFDAGRLLFCCLEAWDNQEDVFLFLP